MKQDKRARLEAAGYRVGSVADFLDLTEAEARLIEIKLAMSRTVRARRVATGLTQQELADRMGSSQPRVARLEKGAASMDMLTRALLALGVSGQDLARLLVA